MIQPWCQDKNHLRRCSKKSKRMQITREGHEKMKMKLPQQLYISFSWWGNSLSFQLFLSTPRLRFSRHFIFKTVGENGVFSLWPDDRRRTSRFKGKTDKHCQRYFIRLIVICEGGIEETKKHSIVGADSTDVLELNVDTVMMTAR